MNAWHYFEEELKVKCIPSSSKKLDMALTGGVRLGSITEIAGNSGSGKTQMCLQLTMNVILPDPVSMGGEVVFISTKRNFHTKRVCQLVDTIVFTWQSEKNKSKDEKKFKKKFSREIALKRIHHRLVLTSSDLIKTVYQLVEFVNANANIRLIVIDSFCALLRDLKPFEKIRISHELMQILQDIATAENCAVILTNDMTIATANFEDSAVTPTLGDPFHHRIYQRIVMLKDDNGEIIANVEKNLLKGAASVGVKITERGISDA